MPDFDESFQIAIEIQPRLLTVGVANEPPFLREIIHSRCDVDMSSWQLVENELLITLAKAEKKIVWESALLGNEK